MRELAIRLIIAALLLVNFGVIKRSALAENLSNEKYLAQCPGIADGVDLFSCKLPSRESFLFCMNVEHLTPKLVWIYPSGITKVLDAADLRQSISEQGAHGASIITTSETNVGTISLFVDTNPYDMSKPAISVSERGSIQTEFCVNGSQHMNTGVARVNGKEEVLSISRLQTLGIAKPLVSVPEWPSGDQGGTTPKFVHHPASLNQSR